MEEFERRQDERDERRHAEGNKAQAVEFISKYYTDRGLIPLCAVAAMHNALFHYSRRDVLVILLPCAGGAESGS